MTLKGLDGVTGVDRTDRLQVGHTGPDGTTVHRCFVEDQYSRVKGVRLVPPYSICFVGESQWGGRSPLVD